MARVSRRRTAMVRRRYRAPKELKLAMAVGRLVLGSALGCVLWIVGSYGHFFIALEAERLTGRMDLLDFEWPFNLLACGMFVMGGGLAGLAAGDAPFRKLAGRWRYYL